MNDIKTTPITNKYKNNQRDVDVKNSTLRTYDSIVFGGGGRRCVAHLGVISALEFYHDTNIGYKDKISNTTVSTLKLKHTVYKQFKFIGGISGGCLFAISCAYGRNAKLVERAIAKSDVLNICDWSMISLRIGNGLMNPNVVESALRIFMEDMQINPTTTTLGILEQSTNKKIGFLACNFDTGERITFTGLTHPDVLVLDAMLASMCVPLLFPPKVINNVRYIDGAILDNVGRDMFMLNSKQTLCVSVGSYKPPPANMGWFETVIRIGFFGDLNRNAETRYENPNSKILDLSEFVNMIAFIPGVDEESDALLKHQCIIQSFIETNKHFANPICKDIYKCIDVMIYVLISTHLYL